MLKLCARPRCWRRARITVHINTPEGIVVMYVCRRDAVLWLDSLRPVPD